MPDAGSWAHFEHSADIGVRGTGPDLETAFEQAAVALTAVLTDPDTVAEDKAIEVEVAAPDADLLFVTWLNAVLYEMATNAMVFARFRVRIDGNRLEGTLWGETVDADRHEPAVEIKGATLTELKTGRQDDGTWIAQCVVDV